MIQVHCHYTLLLSAGVGSQVSTTAPRRGAILAAVCLSVFAINVDTTIINVALPSLTGQLGAGTTDLQWIVDGYSLSFAALVLAAGSLGDRYWADCSSRSSAGRAFSSHWCQWPW